MTMDPQWVSAITSGVAVIFSLVAIMKNHNKEQTDRDNTQDIEINTLKNQYDSLAEKLAEQRGEMKAFDNRIDREFNKMWTKLNDIDSHIRNEMSKMSAATLHLTQKVSEILTKQSD